MNQHQLPSDILALPKSCRPCRGADSCRVRQRPPQATRLPPGRSARMSSTPMPRGLEVGDAKVKVIGGDMPVYYARPPSRLRRIITSGWAT